MGKIDEILQNFVAKNGQKKWPIGQKSVQKWPVAKTENKNGHEFWAWLSHFWPVWPKIPYIYLIKKKIKILYINKNGVNFWVFGHKGIFRVNQG